MAEKNENQDSLGCVNQIFNTSKGLVAIMDFTKGTIPLVGSMLESASGHKWKIVGNSMPMFIEFTKFTFTPRFGEYVCECLLQPIEHTEKLNEGEILKLL